MYQRTLGKALYERHFCISIRNLKHLSPKDAVLTSLITEATKNKQIKCSASFWTHFQMNIYVAYKPNCTQPGKKKFYRKTGTAELIKYQLGSAPH